ncbi:hypothetical protein C4587_01005 [Candidatus Parcubacteria bacterium]|nr:MAG: hypothetical protein C4587_01005 [Candidatus Parcubacteria bacterium]
MADNNLGALWQLIGAGQGIGELGKAHEQAVGRFGENYYDPFTKAYGFAPGLLANFYGGEGAPGFDAAYQRFTESPTYQYGLNQGEESVKRNAASLGRLGSGNTLMDLNKFGQDYASQRLGQYLSGLGGIADAGFNAAQGQTGRQETLAGIDIQRGLGAANIWNNVGNNLAELYQPRPQQGGGIGGAIAGGLKLGGQLLGGLGGLGGFKPLGASA